MFVHNDEYALHNFLTVYITYKTVLTNECKIKDIHDSCMIWLHMRPLPIDSKWNTCKQLKGNVRPSNMTTNSYRIVIYTMPWPETNVELKKSFVMQKPITATELQTCTSLGGRHTISISGFNMVIIVQLASYIGYWCNSTTEENANISLYERWRRVDRLKDIR